MNYISFPGETPIMLLSCESGHEILNILSGKIQLIELAEP